MPFRVIPDTAIPGAGKGTPQTKMPAAAGAGASPVHVCTDSIRNPNGSSAVYSCHGLLNHPSIPGLAESLYGSPGFRPTPGLIPLGTRDGSAFYSPLTSVPYDVKDSIEVWRGLTQAGPCFPYDSTMAVYPYGTGYAGIDLNARRKNATRETTTTLKAWLYEHRKNPYPTKGEKIMLAIITKMTLTQVSTWFANARRRLKKENKMTWSPRNRSDDDENDDDFDRDYKKDEPDIRVDDDDEENCEEKEISITDADTDNGSRVNMPVHDFKDNETSNSSFENIDDDKIDDEKGMDLTMNVKKKDESEKPISSNTEDCLDSGKLDRTSVSGSSLKLLSTVKIRRDSQQNVPTARPKIWSVSQLLDKSPDDKISEDAQVSSEQTKSLHRLGLGSSLSEVPRISGSSIRTLHSLSMARSHPYPFQMNSFLPSGFPSSVGDSERSSLRQTLPFSSSRSIMKH